MEPAGFAIGIVGLFNSVVAIVNGLSSLRSCDKDFRAFSVMVRADYHRFLHWGREVGLHRGDNFDGPYDLHPRLNDSGTAAAVRDLLTLAIETFGEAEEVMQKQKLKAGLSRSSRSLSLSFSSRQVGEKLRRSSRSWPFKSKQKALGDAVEMGIMADQYGNTTNNRMFPTKKVTIMTRIKWAGFRKSQAEELQQKLGRFVDKLEALVPVPALGMQSNIAPLDLGDLGMGGCVTDCGGTSLEGLNPIDGGVSEIIHSVDNHRKLKLRKARQLRMQYSPRQGIKKTTGHVARINR
jgi:hypothetical protein